MTVIMVVAYDDQRTIGKEGKLPWPHFSEDMKLFKARTSGHWVVMGRKTWDSLPVKPLPKRFNIVLTHQGGDLPFTDDEEGPVFFSDFKALLKIAKERGEDLYIIGGASIYEMALKLGVVDRIIVSKISGVYTGDRQFPILLDERWQAISTEQHEGFQVIEYVKK